MRKLKVVVSGIHYPLSMMSYFIRALQRRDDVDLITVGPFTNTYIPWNDGMHLPINYVHTPTHPLSPDVIRVGKVSPQIFQVYEDMHDVDLWIEVDAGFYLDPKPSSGIVAHVATDPHVLDYDRQRQLADFFFCMQSPYMRVELGDFYLPYAFDPTIHFPIEGIEKEYDACIIGLQYAQRVSLVNLLRANGLKVYQDIGKVYGEYNLIYNKSRVALSWSSLQDMPARVWEAIGMGVPLVTNRVPDLSTFFVEDEHYLGFSNVAEAVSKVKWVLENPDKAATMANNAHRKAIAQNHTWDNRVQQILETVKLR
jgi:glycosyltransferase involved in cell wall biosynthesis